MYDPALRLNKPKTPETGFISGGRGGYSRGACRVAGYRVPGDATLQLLPERDRCQPAADRRRGAELVAAGAPGNFEGASEDDR